MVKIIVNANGINLDAVLTDDSLSELIELIKKFRQENFSGEVRTEEVDSIQGSRKVSLGGYKLSELLNSVSWKGIAEKVLIFAAWLELQNGQSAWQTADLREVFARAKEPLPANLSRDVSKTISNGWIHQETTRTYRVTREGLNVVDRILGVRN